MHVDSPVHLRGNKNQNKNMRSLCQRNNLSPVLPDKGTRYEAFGFTGTHVQSLSLYIADFSGLLFNNWIC